jgi:hypothetical protein
LMTVNKNKKEIDLTEIFMFLILLLF